MRAFPRVSLRATLAALSLMGLVAVTSDDTASAQPAAKPVTTSSGLQIIDTKVGTGASPRQNQTAVVHYTGWLYVNGYLVDHREQKGMWWINDYGFEWDADLTDKLKPGANTITVRLQNPHHFGGMFRRPFLYAATEGQP